MTEIKLSITFKAETSRIYLLCELEGGSVADYHRPNVLTDYHEKTEDIGGWEG